MANFPCTEWEQTSPGQFKTQLPDGSIWGWTVATGEISEVTNLHAKNPCLNASYLQSAQVQIDAWANR